MHWWYDWWDPFGLGETTDANYCHEQGEHNGAYADTNCAYFVWSDNRVQCTYHGANTNVQVWSRYQPDVRLARLPWP